jgi:hypothetical protein
MTSGILEGEHDISQLRVGDLAAFTEMADRIILAEDAAEVAVAEKYGA